MAWVGMRKFAVRSESCGLNPETECKVFALKPLAALFEDAVRTTLSKYISQIGLTMSNMTVDLPHPPPPTAPIRGKPRSLGSLYCAGELLSVAPAAIGCAPEG